MFSNAIFEGMLNVRYSVWLFILALLHLAGSRYRRGMTKATVRDRQPPLLPSRCLSLRLLANYGYHLSAVPSPFCTAGSALDDQAEQGEKGSEEQEQRRRARNKDGLDEVQD
jgi:hypothetical protein